MENDVFLAGVGSYVPSRTLSNEDIQNFVNKTPAWVRKRTGISARRIAEKSQNSSDLAFEASKEALKDAGLEPAQIDLIVFATITPDTQCPSAANWLQDKLSAKNAISFDIAAACSGFIFAIDVAEKYLQSKKFTNVLVVAAEVMSRTVNWSDPASSILWGDGAGAIILTNTDAGKKPKLRSVYLKTDGSKGQDLLLPGGGSATTPFSNESIASGKHYLKIRNAHTTMKIAVEKFSEAISQPALEVGLSVGEIDWFVLHQANLRIIEAVSKKLGTNFSKYVLTIQKYGNSSSASVAIAFDLGRKRHFKRGEIICLAVFGGGLTWGGAIIEW